MGKFLKDNGLSVAFWLLFLLCLLGQAIAATRMMHAGDGVAGLLRVFGRPEFLKAVFSNWQAALLQLLALIVFAVFLRQRGASHSKKAEGEPQDPPEPDQQRPARKRSWLYRNSLSVVFALLFAGAFASFVACDYAVSNKPTLAAFAASPDFWFDTFQTWQAEAFAMGVFLVLSIVLRQEGSAESKRISASDDDTGEVNE